VIQCSHRAQKAVEKKLYIILAIVVVLLGGAGVVAAKKKGEKPIPITTEKAFRKTILFFFRPSPSSSPPPARFSRRWRQDRARGFGRDHRADGERGTESCTRGDLLLRIRPAANRAQGRVAGSGPQRREGGQRSAPRRAAKAAAGLQSASRASTIST